MSNIISITKSEVDARLKRYGNTENMQVKCRYCVPGYRHSVGNCFICGWGPSPCSIEFMGLKSIPMERLNAEYGQTDAHKIYCEEED